MRGWQVAVVSGLTAALAGCAASNGPPGEITRFHVAGPIARGTVSIAPVSGDPNDLEFRTDAAAVAPAIAAAGFTLVAPNVPADLVAVIDVRRGSFATPPRGPAFSFGVGGASFGRHTGVGGDADVGIGPHPGTAIGTSLSIQLRRRSDNVPVWEGRGRTSAAAGSPGADLATAVGRLAGALFAGFPGESGRTVVLRP